MTTEVATHEPIAGRFTKDNAAEHGRRGAASREARRLDRLTQRSAEHAAVVLSAPRAVDVLLAELDRGGFGALLSAVRLLEAV